MKNLILLVTVILLFFTSLFYRSSTVDTHIISDKSINNNSTSNINIEHETDKKLKNNKDKLAHIAVKIQPVSDEILKETWQDEYGCGLKKSCEFKMLNAKSYEEAIWMKRKGYLSSSIVNMLNEFSHKDLSILANHGNNNALKMMAILGIQKKNAKLAKSNARKATANENGGETFSLRLMAQAHLLNNKPSLASVQLRMASLLGDTDAAIEYEILTRYSAREVIDNWNMLAFRFLSTRLNIPMNEWDNDPRPAGPVGG